MRYPDKTAHGDAGEFYFAYQIASVLKWPCRLFDIDIGVDAQVEVLDEKGHSTGKFVAFQIKATNVEKHGARTYVSKKHLAYWRSLDFPVFVVRVDLRKQAMYLRQITRDETDLPTDRVRVGIEFDLIKHRFTEATGAVIKAAADEAAISAVREYLSPVQEGIERMRKAVGQAAVTPEPQLLIDIMLGRGALRGKLAQAEALARNLRAGEHECLQLESQLDEALGELREFMIDGEMHVDWDDSGEIAKFIEEGS